MVLNPLTNSNITVEHNDTATTLTRSNMPANGEGEYECVAANLVGQSQKRINVRVQCEWECYSSGSGKVVVW